MVLFDEKKPEVQKSRGTVPHVRGTVLLNRATIFLQTLYLTKDIKLLFSISK
jgi:hypothetical protein